MKVDSFVQSSASRISDNASPALKVADDAADLVKCSLGVDVRIPASYRLILPILLKCKS